LADKQGIKQILVIDDSLAMDLAGMRVNSRISSVFYNGKDSPNVIHVTSEESALSGLQYLDKDTTIDAVICDYKLEGENGVSWGPDILARLKSNPQMQNAKFFLMSKSGFRDQDKPKLEAIGAEYFHTNEFFYAVAHEEQNEGLKVANSQRAKTSNFRQWCNENLGKEYPLDVYRSANIKEAERGMIPVNEVMRRAREGGREFLHSEAFDLLDRDSVQRLMRPHVESDSIPEAERVKVGKGVEGPPRVGRVAFNEQDIETIKRAHPNDPVILVLEREYLAQDNDLLLKVDGLVMLGSGTQHIPVLAKNRNMPVLFANRDKYPEFSVRGEELIAHDGLIERGVFAKRGDWVTIDGNTLELFSGKREIVPPREEDLADIRELASMADYNLRLPWHVKNQQTGIISDKIGLKVLGNADNAKDVAFVKSVDGSRGVGLFRTEHLFLETQGRELLQTAILAKDPALRESAIKALGEMQQTEFEESFVHGSKDFTIRVRLLDAPPAEFLPDPKDDTAITALAARVQRPVEEVRAECAEYRDQNIRGAAFGMKNPDIYKSQIEAIFEAAKKFPEYTPEIMIPLLRTQDELDTFQREIRYAASDRGFEQESIQIKPTKQEITALKEIAEWKREHPDADHWEASDAIDDIAKKYKVDDDYSRWRRLLDDSENNREPTRPYRFGVMIETRQTSLSSDYHYEEEHEPAEKLLEQIAKNCEFASIGSNDLIEELLKIKRGDVKAVEEWCKKNNTPFDPFKTLGEIDSVQKIIALTTGELHYHNKKLDISLCGNQATDRATVNMCQWYGLQSISLPPTPDGMYQGMIEAGRTAVLNAAKERERIIDGLRKEKEMRNRTSQGRLPEEAEVDAAHAIKHSPLVGIVIEDEDFWMDAAKVELTGMPAVFCADINTACHAIDAMQAAGKKVVILTDACVPAVFHDSQSEHSFINTVTNRGDINNGVGFANAIAEGNWPGLTAKDVAIASMGSWSRDLDQGVAHVDKGSSYGTPYKNWLEEKLEAARSIKPAHTQAPLAPIDPSAWRKDVEVVNAQAIDASPVTFLCVDDDSYIMDMFQRQMKNPPIVNCPNINAALHTADMLRKAGRRVCFFMDANVHAELYGSDEGDRHPDIIHCEMHHNDDLSPGVLFANAVADGKIAGIAPSDIALQTMNAYVEGIDYPFERINKDDDYAKDATKFMDKKIAEAMAARRGAAPDVSEKTSNHVIICVDDEEHYRDLMRSGVERAFPGCRVHVLEDADDAYHSIKQDKPHFLMLDYLMPGLTGMDLVERLKEEGRLEHMGIAIVTQSDELLAHAKDSTVPIFSKAHLRTLHNPENPLRKHMEAQLAQHGQDSGRQAGRYSGRE
jgi:phosphoenolpyruvate-protein kinase (PTS system EI component)/response regulator RpfG family c-di-GMP phosphodiesterase